MKVRKAVFPVAGFGTRMLPATKAIPKEMITLLDKPLIQYSVEEAIAAGIEQIIFVTGRTKRSLEDYFDQNVELNRALEESRKYEMLAMMDKISTMADIVYVRQKEQLGLGHAVLCAKDIVGNEPFAVILPDDIFLAKSPVTKQLVEQYERTKSSVLALFEVPADHTHRYGIVSTSESVDGRLFRLADMVEKPKHNPPSNMAIIGRYVLTPEVMDALVNTEPGALGEIQLTDAIRQVTKNGEVYGYLYEGERFDCGNKLGYLEATMNFAWAQKDTREEMLRIVRKLGL